MIKEKDTEKKEKSDGKYIETVGRRKTSIARVRIFPGHKLEIIVNDKPVEAYFPNDEMRQMATTPMRVSDVGTKFKITAVIKGGGIHSQAEALRHGISRGLVEFKAELRDVLKKAKFLKRDPRAKERRKFGLKKARKSPQWSKR